MQHRIEKSTYTVAGPGEVVDVDGDNGSAVFAALFLRSFLARHDAFAGMGWDGQRLRVGGN